ncbi:MAG: hypothetical protein WC054_05025 [Candidatus Nanopelagicales bacterium]
MHLQSLERPRGSSTAVVHPRRTIQALLITLVLLLITSGTALAAPTDPPKPPPGPPVEVSALPGSTPPPELDAFAWAIADADTGEVLAAKGCQHRLPQASTTKALTALTVIPHLDPSATYVATKKDANAEGSRVGIEAGATYTINDLLLGLMLPSGNDAASALANANGGWQTTLAQMNGEARRLGAMNTVVHNPSGLDTPGHHSTACDLMTIFRAGLELPLFRKLVGTKTANFPGEMPKPGKKRSAYPISNQDRLLQQNYPGIIGGKTGYTTNAGRTFVGAAQRNGHTLLIAILRTQQYLDEAGEKLLNWGFANVGKVTALTTLPEPGDVDPGQTAETENAVAKVETAPVSATVASSQASTADLPWLLIALAVFLTVLAAAAILRARAVLRTPK